MGKYDRKGYKNWVSYILVIIGTVGVSLAYTQRQGRSREDNLIVKYGACLTDQNKLLLKMASEQAAFLNAEMKSTSELLGCKQTVLRCSDRVKAIRKQKRK